MGFRWCPFCGEPHALNAEVCPKHGTALTGGIHHVRRTERSPRRGTTLQGRLVAAGSYVLEQLVGEGATSWVFLARHTPTNNQVAIKVAKPLVRGDRRGAASTSLQRFEQEACVLLGLAHPNICRMLDFGKRQDGTPFLVMERLRGQTLSSTLQKSGALPLPVALSIASQMLEGLGAAHALGIAHRDVKPANVFLAKQDTFFGEPRVKLLDFGLAKLPKGRAFVYTKPGYTVGTPSYMAPEVIRGAAADGRADLWAVGVVLFEMLAGSHPFPEAYTRHYSWPAIKKTPEAITRFVPGAPNRLRWVLERAFEKEPERRFQTAREMHEELAAVRDEWGSMPHFEVGSEDLIPVLHDSSGGSRTQITARLVAHAGAHPGSSDEITEKMIVR